MLDSMTAVVVNWNLPEMTIRCVEALIADGLPAERLVIVENGSDASSTDALRRRFPSSRLVRLEENIGYARAANRGASEQLAGSYIFVNNDAFVELPGSLERLTSALAHSGVGIAVPRLLNPDKTLQRNVVPLPTPLVALCLAIGASRIVPNRIRPFWSNWWDHATSQVVAASSGAVIAVRGDVWRQLGGWPEQDWMYGEDLDLSWRAAKVGWNTWFEHDAVFVHLGNASGFVDVERMWLTSTATRRLMERELQPVQAKIALAAFSAGYLARAILFKALRREREACLAWVALRAYSPIARPLEGPPGSTAGRARSTR